MLMNIDYKPILTNCVEYLKKNESYPYGENIPVFRQTKLESINSRRIRSLEADINVFDLARITSGKYSEKEYVFLVTHNNPSKHPIMFIPAEKPSFSGLVFRVLDHNVEYVTSTSRLEADLQLLCRENNLSALLK